MPNQWTDPWSYKGLDASYGNDDGIDVLTIGAQPATSTELKNEIRNAGGVLITDKGSDRVLLAKKSWWEFSVENSLDGAKVRITENNYLLYGGIGAVALVLIIAMAHK